MTPGHHHVIRILLVDDHETVRHGLKLLIESQRDMRVVGEAGTGVAAVHESESLRPDVVVLDVSMPEGNGVQAAREIAAATPTAAIVALTRHTDDAYVQALLGAGARAYVLKQSTSSELLNAVRAVSKGRLYLDAAVADRVAGAFAARHAAGDDAVPRTSDREIEVLRLIATGFSNKEIAQQLDLSVKTVEVHRANAMRKLGLRGRVDIVRYAVQQGWLLEA